MGFSTANCLINVGLVVEETSTSMVELADKMSGEVWRGLDRAMMIKVEDGCVWFRQL